MGFYRKSLEKRLAANPADTAALEQIQALNSKLIQEPRSQPAAIKDLLSWGSWKEVFKYASGFSQEDVCHILASDEGHNDGPDWVMAGMLCDGRYFVIRAGCDYTGWG